MRGVDLEMVERPFDGCGKCLLGVRRLSRMKAVTTSPERQRESVLSAAADGIHVVPDGELLHIECGPGGGALLVHPAPAAPVELRAIDAGARGTASLGLRSTGASGIFTRFRVEAPSDVPEAELVELAAATGPAPLRVGGSLGRAAAPVAEDYAAALTLRVEIGPRALAGVHRLLLRLDWVGDAARAELDGTLIADQYWNGAPWEIDLARHRAALEDGAELILRLLPFDPAAAVHVPEDLRPDEVTLRVAEARLVPTYRGAVGIGAA